MTNNLENYVIDHFFRNSASGYTPAATMRVALFTADPGEAGSMTNEVANANGYSRQSVTFSAASGGATSNSGAVSFTASGGNFGTVTHIGITDSATHQGGTMLMYASITSAAVNDGDTLNFAIGEIDITMA